MTETGQKSHVKELFSHTVFYGIGLFLNKSLSILLLPLYTIYFSTQELGLYAIIFSIWMFVNIVYIYGTETSFLKFFIDAENKKDKASIYTTTLAMMSVSSLVFSAVIYLLSGNIVQMIGFENPAHAVEMVKILSALLFFDGLMRFPLLLLRAELKAKTYAILTIISLCTNLALNFILIIHFRMSVDAILYSYIASSILTLIAGLIITRGYIGGGINMKVVKELVKYGNKFIYIGVFLIFIEQSDRFFIKYFYDESMVGIYSANYRLAAVMSLIIASFRFSWTPYFLNIAKNPENKKIIANIFTYFIFGSSLLFLTLSFFIETIVTTQVFRIYLLDPAYWPGLNIIPVLLLSYFFSGVCAYLNVAPFFANKTSFLLLSAFIGFCGKYHAEFYTHPAVWHHRSGIFCARDLCRTVHFSLCHFPEDIQD